MSITLSEAVQTGNVRLSCRALVTIKESKLLTTGQLEALTDLVLEPLVEWAWREVMKKWETGDDFQRGMTIQTWLLGKMLHEIVRDPVTASELIELAQMIALEQSGHGLTVFKTMLGKKLTAHGHRLVYFQSFALGERQTILCTVA